MTVFDLARYALRLPDDYDRGLCCALCAMRGRSGEPARILYDPDAAHAWDEGMSICDGCARELVEDVDLDGRARLALAIAVIRGIE